MREPPPVAFLKVEFSPAWRFIDDVRRFVESFCYNMKVDGDRASTVGLTIHELLQNALNYSVDGWASLLVEIHILDRKVAVTSMSRGKPEQVSRLNAIVERMEKEPDPLKHYLELMQETVKREEGSGLGLARIRFEGRMNVSVKINEDGQVIVRASGDLEAPPLLADAGAGSGSQKETTHG